MSKPHKPKVSNWFQNKGATERVLQLLDDSGALLETKVSGVCQEFARSNHKRLGVRVESDSVTYGENTEESPLRQIDQRVSLYKEFGLDDLTGVQLHVQIPIEVKYRKDVEVFGIPYPPKSYFPRIPAVGFVLGSQLSSVFEGASPLPSLPLVQPVLLEIRDGSTPQKVHSENVIYNTASALYDYTKFDFRIEHLEEENSYERGIIRRMQLVERFEQYLKEASYAWWAVLSSWMQGNLTDALSEEFNRRIGEGRVYYGVSAHIPVLCLNGLAWIYESGSFDRSDAIVTRVRVPAWPGKLRTELIRYTTEAPLVITNVEGLTPVLKGALDWFFSIESALKACDRGIKRRWHIESAFYREALARALQKDRDAGVRSDLDIFEFL